VPGCKDAIRWHGVGTAPLRSGLGRWGECAGSGRAAGVAAGFAVMPVSGLLGTYGRSVDALARAVVSSVAYLWRHPARESAIANC
jgi:hypothetical protein